MSISGYVQQSVFWVEPNTRQVWYIGDPNISSRAKTTGRWFATYTSTTVSGDTRLYDITLQMASAADITQYTQDPISPPLWDRFLLSSKPYRQAITDDVLRSANWDTSHGDITTTSVGDPSRIGYDTDLHVTDVSNSFNMANTLFFVNGVYHVSVPDPNNANAMFLKNGFRTLQNGRDFRQVHAIDFTPIDDIAVTPLTSNMVSYQSDTSGTCTYIQYPDGGLLTSTVMVIIDGLFHFAGDHITVMSDTLLRVNHIPLDLPRCFYQSPLVRKVPDTYTFGTKTTSPPVDDDVFANNTVVPRVELTNDAFIISRFLSPHSAVVLLPQNLAVLPIQTQYETDQKDLICTLSNNAVQNTSLLYKSMIGSPTFLEAHATTPRSFLWMPWKSKPQSIPEDDPLRIVDVAPEKDTDREFDIRSPVSLVQWVGVL